MKTVLITGKNGQLGKKIKDISDECPDLKFIFAGRNELDISNQDSVKNYFKENKIGLLINCAAFTAVDDAENNYEDAYNVNCLALKYLASASKEHDFKIIHVSTDYVFDGKANTPYKEEDRLSPVNLYGKSKLEGELALQNINPCSIIVRTSWLYSEYGKNFAKTILKFAKEKESLIVVFDQVGTPTYAGDLAKALLKIADNYFNNGVFNKGVYHFSNQGVCSWYDFAYEILRLTEIKTNITPVRSHRFPAKAKRPNYSVLDKSKICLKYDMEIPHWTQGLIECLQNIKEKS